MKHASDKPRSILSKNNPQTFSSSYARDVYPPSGKDARPKTRSCPVLPDSLLVLVRSSRNLATPLYQKYVVDLSNPSKGEGGNSRRVNKQRITRD